MRVAEIAVPGEILKDPRPGMYSTASSVMRIGFAGGSALPLNVTPSLSTRSKWIWVDAASSRAEAVVNVV